MICINLLHWRERKLASLRRKLIYSCILAFILPCCIVAIISVKQVSLIESKTRDLEKFRMHNQHSLSKIQSLKDNEKETKRLNSRLQLVNQVINHRERIPQVLSALAKINHNGDLGHLYVDQTQLTIQGYEASLERALSLFQLLNDHSVFCQVEFSPISTKLSNTGTGQYEFRAHICDA